MARDGTTPSEPAAPDRARIAPVIPLFGGTRPSRRGHWKSKDLESPLMRAMLSRGLQAGWPALELVDDLDRDDQVLPPPRHTPVVLRLRVDLNHAKPPIWRRLEVRGDLTLAQLHLILQASMGWADRDPHVFIRRARHAKASELRFESGPDMDGAVATEAKARLDQVFRRVGDRLSYDYGRGSAWSHTVRVEALSKGEMTPRWAYCLGGRRACPPEALGGMARYNELTGAGAASSSPAEASVAETLPAGFDPTAFDVAEANRALAMAQACHPSQSGRRR